VATHRYAEKTQVPVARSKQELDELLARHGATQRGMGVDDEKGESVCYFSLEGRQILLRIPLPKRNDYASQDRWEQACRARWRAMVLITRAKLEHIALGLSTVEHEFLANIRLSNGRTIGDEIAPGLEALYTSGKMPPLLGMGS
jgi:hypothetical protein